MGLSINDKYVSGSESEPWATLSFAVSRLRVLRTGAGAPGPASVVTIHLTGATHHVAQTVKLSGSRDSWLVIRNYRGQTPTISGGIPLDMDWQQDGDIRTGVVNATCGELYYGDYRLKGT